MLNELPCPNCGAILEQRNVLNSKFYRFQKDNKVYKGYEDFLKKVMYQSPSSCKDYVLFCTNCHNAYSHAQFNKN